MDWYVISLILGLFFVFLAFLMMSKEKKKELTKAQGFHDTLKTKEAEIKPDISKKREKYIDDEKELLLKILRDAKKESSIKEDVCVDKKDFEGSLYDYILDEKENDKDKTFDRRKNIDVDNSDSEKIYAYRDGRNLIINEKRPVDSLTSKVLTLRDEGYSVQSISKELNRGVREVEMILNINKKS